MTVLVWTHGQSFTQHHLDDSSRSTTSSVSKVPTSSTVSHSTVPPSVYESFGSSSFSFLILSWSLRIRSRYRSTYRSTLGMYFGTYTRYVHRYQLLQVLPVWVSDRESQTTTEGYPLEGLEEDHPTSPRNEKMVMK